MPLITLNVIEKKSEKLQQLSQELEETVKEPKEKPGKKKLEKKRRILNQQIESFENQQLTRVLKQLQQKYFEGANKPRKYLANQLKRKKEKRIISKISKDKKEIMNEKRLKNPFLIIMQIYIRKI